MPFLTVKGQVSIIFSSIPLSSHFEPNHKFRHMKTLYELVMLDRFYLGRPASQLAIAL